MTCTNTTAQQSSTLCPPKRHRRKFSIIALTSLIFVFSILTLTGCKSSNNNKVTGYSNPKAVVSAFIDAVAEGNGDALVNLYPPELVSLLNEHSDEPLNEYVQKILDSGSESFTRYYGPGWTMKFSIQDYRNATKNEIEELKNIFASIESEIKIEEVKIYEVEQVIKGIFHSSSFTHELYVIKVNNRWYLDFYHTSL